MATIRKRQGKRGITWQIDYYDPQGRRVMKCFAKKAEAEAYLGKVVSLKREGRYQDIFDVKRETLATFNDLADQYCDFHKAQRSFIRMKRYMVRDLRAAFGDKLLSEITFRDLETYCNERRNTPTWTGNPRTAATVNREMATLRHMFTKAKEWEIMETSPFVPGKLMAKENNHRLRFLNGHEIGALLAECPAHLKPIVETALHTGMRKEELLSIKWDQIRNGFIYLTETKGGKARQIPINDHLAGVLKELRRKDQLKAPWVFCDSLGRRFLDVKRSFAAACRRAGIEGFRFHDLRHTFASQLVMKGASLKAVQELLGHASLAMTMRYAHLSHDHLKDSVNLLNSMATGKETVNTSPKRRKARPAQVANFP
jgi:integrase